MSVYLSWSHTIALTPFQMFFSQIWQQSPAPTARVISLDCAWFCLKKDCDLTLTWLDMLHDLTWLEWSGNLTKSSIVILSHRHNLWHVWPTLTHFFDHLCQFTLTNSPEATWLCCWRMQTSSCCPLGGEVNSKWEQKSALFLHGVLATFCPISVSDSFG